MVEAHGGNAILESKGDFGELLFSASAGLAGISSILEAAITEADGIFRILAPDVRSFNRIVLGPGLLTVALTVWRIADLRHPPLDAWGARTFGGRWNKPGNSVLYTADSALGAIDEVKFYRKRAVAETRSSQVSVELALHKIHASGAVELADLPFEDERTADWSQSSHLGDKWYNEAQSPILAYHSTFAPNGFNFVLNLTHPALKVELLSSYPVRMQLV